MAAAFPRDLIARVPCRIHILTDNGLRFANRKKGRNVPVHDFDRVCRDNGGIGHRQTKVGHPWTNGQVERMNRTIGEATVKRCYYGSRQQLREHLDKFPDAYNFAKRLKSLRGKTAWEEIINWWKKKPECFITKPLFQKLRQNI